MLKVFGLFKRRPGLSMEEFITHYETSHAPLGVKYLPTMVRYARHYLTPVAEPIDGAVQEADYDVITELWFEDRAGYEQALAAIQAPGAKAELTADEERLFDRTKNRLVFVDTRESVLPSGIAGAD